jgi:hypothetical protein
MFDVFNSARKFVKAAWKAKFSDFFVEEGIAKASCGISHQYYIT